jgi:conjugative transposon TraN protein
MNRIRAVMTMGLFLLFVNTIAYSQKMAEVLKATIIEPYHLTITWNKTTNLIFPYAIKSVDRGSQDVLAQKVKGVENILLVKAGKENFAETNLSVITSDGKIYSFILRYSNNPSLLNISFSQDTTLEGAVALLQPGNNEAQMQLTAERIANEKRMPYRLGDHKFGMNLQLNGIYTKKDVVFYRLQIENRSNIGYDIDMLRFCIRDKKESKRTASQEVELQPLYICNDTTAIKGQSNRTFVFALPKFTIPDKKYLSIQLMEQNGGRHLQLRVHNRRIVKAELVN